MYKKPKNYINNLQVISSTKPVNKKKLLIKSYLIKKYLMLNVSYMYKYIKNLEYVWNDIG